MNQKQIATAVAALAVGLALSGCNQSGTPTQSTSSQDASSQSSTSLDASSQSSSSLDASSQSSSSQDASSQSSSSQDASSQSSSSQDGGTQMVNPMVEYDTPDFMERAGFAVTAIPRCWSLEKCYLIEMSDSSSSIADLRLLTPAGESVTLRMRTNTELSDTSGIYGEFTPVAEKTIQGRQVKLQTYEEQWVVLWYWEGFTYSLVAEAPTPLSQERIEGMMDAVIAELVVEGLPSDTFLAPEGSGSSMDGGAQVENRQPAPAK